MLIYTRPKVQQVRRNFPEIAHMNYVVHLLIVIFSGGETPKEIDLGSSYYREEGSTDENEQNFIDDDHHINTQDQQAIDDLFAKYQISSVGDDDSIFAKIGKVSKVIRLSSKKESSRGRSGNVSAGDNGISYDEGVNSFNSSVMDT
ncbi:predicted protein [Chaetoceros tenuissimus]|uniref:Uncharacterized protein n=1 Tax=Chaetoceros tenuissimus TaxID=426638 RepID=A0AAD3H7S7_9STRA|nr:predicted protein [Chaetoceros tenuissimus]